MKSEKLIRYTSTKELLSWTQSDINQFEITLAGGQELLDKYKFKKEEIETVLSGHRMIANQCMNELELGNTYVELEFVIDEFGKLKRDLRFSKLKPESQVINESTDLEFEIWLNNHTNKQAN